MATDSKMQEKKDKLKKELLSKTESKLGNDVLLSFRAGPLQRAKCALPSKRVKGVGTP